MTFKDMTEFEKWKNEEERMTKSWYVKHRADRRSTQNHGCDAIELARLSPKAREREQ